MRIHCYDLEACRRLQFSFEELGLIYGKSTAYSSLLAPASVHLSQIEAADLESDIEALASLYRTSNEIYLASIRAEAPPWISTLVEQGLTPVQCAAHRLVAAANLEPMMGRVDYVEISVNHRQVAEVQWKSGGPGFFYGHETAFRQVFPPMKSTLILGDLVGKYIDALVACSPHEAVAVVNEVREEWLNGESHLCKACRLRDLLYYPVGRAGLEQALYLSEGNLFVRTPDGERPVTVLRGRGFTDVLDDDFIMKLVEASTEGKLWIETPPNFIYRQKWELALPFITSFRGLFDKRISEIVIPTALIVDDHLDLTPIAAGIPEEHRERALKLRSLEDVPELPSVVRQHLVLKCGAGVGDLHDRGRGVFRLTGSRASAARIVQMVRDRVLGQQEPWIVQSYVNHKYQVPIAIPFAGNMAEVEKVHARIMVFGSRDAQRVWRVHGAIGNFGKHWKVSGTRAGQGEAGQLLGSAFTDVRVEANL